MGRGPPSVEPTAPRRPHVRVDRGGAGRHGRHPAVPDFDQRRLVQEFFGVYADGDQDPGKTAFLDGGVLDNFPFEHAIRAIIAKPASSEVTRKLLYIQPDPGHRFRPPPDTSPGWL